MSSLRKKSKSLLEIIKFLHRAIMSPKVQLRVHVLHSLFPVPLVPGPITVVKLDLFPILKIVFLIFCQYAFGKVYGQGEVRRATDECF